VVPLCRDLSTANAGEHRNWLVVVTVAWSIGAFLLITISATNGWTFRHGTDRPSIPTWTRAILAFCGTLLASSIPLFVIAKYWENRPWHVIGLLANPIHGSLALVWGDAFTLPILMIVCTFAWVHLPVRGWHRSPLWLVFSVVFGIGVAYLFHRSTAHAYDYFRYNSFSNIFHDIGAFVTLSSATMFLAAPVVFRKEAAWKYRGFAIGLLVVMGLLLVHEALYPLATWVYHPAADLHEWGRVVPCVLMRRS
jgi:hypothetical protein